MKTSSRPSADPGNSPRAVKTPAINIDEAVIHIENMLAQKERIRALLFVIDAQLGNDEPEIKTLVGLARDINARHRSWYELERCLGIEGRISSPGE